MWIEAQPLTREAFAPYGDVIDAASHRDRFEINDGYTTRVHDLFRPEVLGEGARVLVNFFLGRPRPLEAAMLERHPLGSQAFIPIDPHDWWVVVASGPDAAAVRVFRARGTQGVNYRAGTWHHPLLVDRPQRFLVIDRGGEGSNLKRPRSKPRCAGRKPEGGGREARGPRGGNGTESIARQSS